MEIVTFKEGIPTCPRCGSQEFRITFKELISYELDANQGNEGWGSSEPLGDFYPEPINAVFCRGCGNDIEVTPELVAFIQKIE